MDPNNRSCLSKKSPTTTTTIDTPPQPHNNTTTTTTIIETPLPPLTSPPPLHRQHHHHQCITTSEYKSKTTKVKDSKESSNISMAFRRNNHNEYPQSSDRDKTTPLNCLIVETGSNTKADIEKDEMKCHVCNFLIKN